MRTRTRIVAALELALIFPAALFMMALAVRNMLPLQYEPAHIAQRIIVWYSGRMWTLWVLLLALPFAVLITGAVTLLRDRDRDVGLPNTARQSLAVLREHPAKLLVAATTLTAAGILVIVVLHMLAN
ncbi:MAG: hypothetical protein DMG35_17335 [Acidobacteria bacterium]|nr:MAG: hypothetical protein AUH86_20320 [Acidobacteria bacterium 13_1_40CM_4_58_4]PYT58527.1 MAG: hypothetical protein DMG35_17335 [Acidobacteriota bacterium]